MKKQLIRVVWALLFVGMTLLAGDEGGLVKPVIPDPEGKRQLVANVYKGVFIAETKKQEDRLVVQRRLKNKLIERRGGLSKYLDSLFKEYLEDETIIDSAGKTSSTNLLKLVDEVSFLLLYRRDLEIIYCFLYKFIKRSYEHFPEDFIGSVTFLVGFFKAREFDWAQLDTDLPFSELIILLESCLFRLSGDSFSAQGISRLRLPERVTAPAGGVVGCVEGAKKPKKQSGRAARRAAQRDLESAAPHEEGPAGAGSGAQAESYLSPAEYKFIASTANKLMVAGESFCADQGRKSFEAFIMVFLEIFGQRIRSTVDLHKEKAKTKMYSWLNDFLHHANAPFFPYEDRLLVAYEWLALFPDALFVNAEELALFLELKGREYRLDFAKNNFFKNPSKDSFKSCLFVFEEIFKQVISCKRIKYREEFAAFEQVPRLEEEKINMISWLKDLFLSPSGSAFDIESRRLAAHEYYLEDATCFEHLGFNLLEKMRSFFAVKSE